MAIPPKLTISKQEINAKTLLIRADAVAKGKGPIEPLVMNDMWQSSAMKRCNPTGAIVGCKRIE
jgi:hypothetical protein